MGKPYSSELLELSNTYTWALQLPIDDLVTAIANCDALPLLCIGSGGSLTAAYFAAQLHEHYTGQVAKAVTPLEVVSAAPNFRNTAALVLSAGGRNPDVLGALKYIAEAEPIRLITVCSRKKSPLGQLAKTYCYVDLIEFVVPAGKDGFLATNSLLAFLVLLSRAYATTYSKNQTLPATLAELLHPNQVFADFYSDLYKRALSLWDKKTLIVLYGPTARSTAVDVESKFTEAALGSTQLADYRNFAHGRHHWLAKHEGTSGIVAIVTKTDQDIAEKTLRHIPKEIPITRLSTEHAGDNALIATFLSALYLVRFAGDARGIDPGRPGVPAFGRKLYHLRVYGQLTSSHKPLTKEIAAIERKTGKTWKALQLSDELDQWREAYRNFVSSLSNAKFRGLIFDYDGTLCDDRERFVGLSNEISSQLERLLKNKVVLGVATGRGKSVKQTLRECLPKKLWGNVFIGYYNGADIGPLTSEDQPDGQETLCEWLMPVREAISTAPLITRLAQCTYRRYQITVEPYSNLDRGQLFDAVQQMVQGLGLSGVIAVRSTHSIDILAPGISKRNLVKVIQQYIGKPDSQQILCIGDQGQFPGNDFVLLQEPYSLSVNESSADLYTCWNLAPQGYRGKQATEYYLQSLTTPRTGICTLIEEVAKR